MKTIRLILTSLSLPVVTFVSFQLMAAPPYNSSTIEKHASASPVALASLEEGAKIPKKKRTPTKSQRETTKL